MAEQLANYIADAHALEQQAIRLLERAPDADGAPNSRTCRQASPRRAANTPPRRRSASQPAGRPPRTRGHGHALRWSQLDGLLRDATPTRPGSSWPSPTRSSTSRSLATSSSSASRSARAIGRRPPCRRHPRRRARRSGEARSPVRPSRRGFSLQEVGASPSFMFEQGDALARRGCPGRLRPSRRPARCSRRFASGALGWST